MKLEYELGASLQHSDNIRLRDTDKVGDTVLSPELNFNATQDSSALQLALEGNLRYPHYLNGTYDDQLQGGLAGNATWKLLPERIDFIVSDVASRQRIDQFDSYTPDNQQQVNVFTAGPSFRARFNEALGGTLDLRYTNTYAEESSEFGGDRYTAALALERLLGNGDTLTMHLDAMQTANDDAGAFYDYRRYDAFVGYGSQLSRLRLDLEAGYSRIKPDNYRGDSSAPLLRARLKWEIAPRSTLGATLNHEFSDAANYLIQQRGQSDGAILETPVDPSLGIGPQSFKQRHLSLSYAYEGERMNVQVSPYSDRLRYLAGNGLDQDVNALGVYLDYRLHPDLTLSLAGLYQKREMDGIDRSDTSRSASVALTRQMSRKWYVRLAYQHSDRTTSGFTNDYTENSLTLSAAWRR
ncbi:MAG: outer membrane beta-barrel protein [Pseudoxanthomonas sp.]